MRSPHYSLLNTLLLKKTVERKRAKALLITRSQELKLQLPDLVYSNVSRLLNGKRTLRDLALKMDKPILELTLGMSLTSLKDICAS